MPNSELKRDSYQFLVDAGRILSQSLEFSVVLKRLTELCVNQFGGLCSVFLDMGKEDEIDYIETAHKDPQLAAFAKDLMKQFPCKRDLPMGVAKVIRENASEIIYQLTENDLLMYSRNRTHLQKIMAFQPKSYMGIALTSRGRPFGAISFIGTGTSYAPEDFELAKELGNIAAIAFDNALLHEATVQAKKDAEVTGAFLRDAMNSREEFFSLASHELRTPLTALMIHTELLRRRFLNKPEQASVDTFVRQLNRLDKLVDNLLHVTKIRNNKLQIRPQMTNLADSIRTVIEDFSQLSVIHRSKVHCQIDENLLAYCDPQRIEQLLSNLLSNAIKFGHGHPITITARHRQDEILMSIRDQGIGIPTDELGRIFNKFEQGLYSKDQGGLGLGLFITQKIVEAHNGTIHISSRPGLGTEVVVMIPSLRPAEPGELAQTTGTPVA